MGIIVSKKIVGYIIKWWILTVMTKRMENHVSYKDEISLEIDNIINRDFHAERPNTKQFTDITEFDITA